MNADILSEKNSNCSTSEYLNSTIDKTNMSEYQRKKAHPISTKKSMVLSNSSSLNYIESQAKNPYTNKKSINDLPSRDGTPMTMASGRKIKIINDIGKNNILNN